MIDRERGESLHVYLPRLPCLDSRGELTWIEEFYWTNCGARLLELRADGSSERSLLDSCTIHKEGTCYRLLVKKGILLSDGSELTGQDVIDSLLRIAADPLSLTQLGSLLLHRGAEMAKSFKLHARYRLEIYLAEPIADLLERLAAPSAWIGRPSAPELSLGEWIPRSIDAKRMILRPHPFRSAEISYAEIILESSDQAPPHFTAHGPASLSLLPGTLAKAPLTNALSETTTVNLRPQFLIGLWLHADAQKRGGTDILRAALQAFARQRSTWRKSRLSHLYYQHPYAWDIPSIDLETKGSLQSWTLSYDPTILAAAFLDDLAAFARHRWNIDLSFHPLSSLDGAIARDGQVFALSEGAPADSLASLQRTLHALTKLPGDNILRPLVQKALQNLRTPRREQLLRECLQKLSHHPQFLPFARTPLLAHSNRVIHEQASSFRFLRLASIGGRLQHKRSEELRLAHVSALGSAVQMLAHDIKRPFGLMESVLQMIASAEEPGQIQDLARRHLPQIKRLTQTIQGMISDILELGTEQELLTEPLSPRAALEESLRFLPTQRKQLRITCDWQHRLMVEGDRYKLTRIFSNLLANALQATPDQGSITISSGERAEREGSQTWIEITIHNSGSYIPPAKREKIFDAFYTEGKEQGTGLGLAIVRKFVLAHEGHLHCESDPKLGTKFIVVLPASYKLDSYQESIAWDHVLHEPVSLAPDPVPLRNDQTVKLLVIDDDPLDGQYIADIVAPLPHLSLQGATDKSSGLARARAEAFDLILLDYQLGDQDGLSLLPEIRALQPRAQIALHSHRSERSLQQTALMQGADLFLPKPLTSQLLSAIASNLHQETSAERPSLVLVEDDPIYIDLWQSLTRLPIRTFSHPQALLDACEAEPSLFAGCRALVTDGRFETGSAGGLDLLSLLAPRFPSLPLYLCSHLAENHHLWPRIIKEPEAIAEFLRHCDLHARG